jgi:hypothetical protein
MMKAANAAGFLSKRIATACPWRAGPSQERAVIERARSVFNTRKRALRGLVHRAT